MKREIDPAAPLWVRLAHRIGRCPRCRVVSFEDGIGGMCIDCGKLHGFMTREELRGLSQFECGDMLGIPRPAPMCDKLWAAIAPVAVAMAATAFFLIAAWIKG